MPVPTLIVVSGPAGAGKTTLAHRLAAAVGCPALSRDELKEGMVRTAGAGFEPTPLDPLTLRTYELFFDTLQGFLAAEVTTVAEAAFQDPLWRRGLGRLPAHRIRVLRCDVDPAIAAERMTARLAEANRAAHADRDHLAGPATFVPLSVEPFLDVDTTAGYRPDLTELINFAIS